MTNSESVPKQQLQNPELADFMNFAELLKKTELPPDKGGFELLEERRADCSPPANPHS